MNMIPKSYYSLKETCLLAVTSYRKAFFLIRELAMGRLSVKVKIHVCCQRQQQFEGPRLGSVRVCVCVPFQCSSQKKPSQYLCR